ncbi:GNAT family N-acetyltransferase [Carboxylicivirga taeanensis]|uniref:GNAT family N-acetyltransferase n=1 Tax=Carboxylicivirga taeanensis TaxID=1416875 RepID=UPI003F6DEF9F
MSTHQIQISAFQDWMKCAVLDIANQELGEGYFKSVLDELKGYALTINCLFKGQYLIGFSLSYRCSLGQFIDATQSHMSISLSSSARILVVKTIVVKAEHQRKGCGTGLLKHLIEEAFREDTKAILALGWKSKSGVNIQHLMATFGFEERCEIKEFWKSGSEKYQYQCPDCGHPCNCSAIIYSKLLSNSNS